MNKTIEILRNRNLSEEEKINLLQNMGLDLEDIFELALKEE